MIKVSVFGALGRMGREVIRAVESDDELSLSCCMDPAVDYNELDGSVLPFEIVHDPGRLNTAEIDVIVDFTRADVAVGNIMWALDNGINSVVGTSGINEDEMTGIAAKSAESGANVIIVPNFAIGAVLMMKFSRIAASLFDQCEVVEFHHRGKIDAPSGTAIETAKQVQEIISGQAPPSAEERIVPGTRGGKMGPVQIHSVRLDGYVAHQEVIFGGRGQTLTIRHDTIDRSCFMPGVIMAIKAIGKTPGLTVGLEPLLGID